MAIDCYHSGFRSLRPRIFSSIPASEVDLMKSDGENDGLHRFKNLRTSMFPFIIHMMGGGESYRESLPIRVAGNPWFLLPDFG